MLDIEETLSRELRQVADGLQVPAMPALPQESARTQRYWPMLAAAAVLVIVVGLLAVVTGNRDDQTPDPAPPSPTPTEVPTTAPTIPYTADDRLYVDGEQVPGRWWYLETGGSTWLAMLADDNTWSWGHGPEQNDITDASLDLAPVMSPNGTFIAVVREYGLLSVIDTRDGGEVGTLPVDFGEPEFRIRAVTDDGKVIVHGTETATLWLPLEDNETVDLTDAAPGQVFVQNTSAGLVVSDGFDGEEYLAEISDAGEITQIGDLPPHDSLMVSPGAEWMAWTPLGTLGGEVTAIETLEVGSVGGGQAATLTAPRSWNFVVHDWVWEDDDYLVAPLHADEGVPIVNPMARCSVLTFSCVLIDAPGGPGGRG